MEIGFELTWAVPPPPGPVKDFELPPGLRFATDFVGGRRFIFESYAKAYLTWDTLKQIHSGIVRARAIRDFEGETLGVSDGKPDQVFPIARGPVLVDFGNIGPAYNPNPRVRVGGVEWELRNFLLAKASQANPVAPTHFMVEEFDNQVRFGDNAFGAIPAAGTAIELIHYQALEGPEALIGKNRIVHFLNPEKVAGLAAGDSLAMTASSEAQGGENFFPPAERMRQGLEAFRNPTRLVTDADFERVVLSDYNAYRRIANGSQGLPDDMGTVLRAEALMNRKPPLTPSPANPASGHVTLLILPAYDRTLFATATMLQKSAMVAVSDDLTHSLLAFLEPRRLLTTRLHVAGAGLKEVNLQVTVVVDGQRNTADMEIAGRAALIGYLDLIDGYEDGRGWPLGRAVRRSQLYRLLEDVPGLDHVESLALTPANAQGDVEVGAGQVPVWDSISIVVKRA